MTHTPEELAMARRIAKKVTDLPPDAITSGLFDLHPSVQSALLAIRATTEAAAKWAEHRVGFGLSHLAADYRANDHLKGKPHDSI